MRLSRTFERIFLGFVDPAIFESRVYLFYCGVRSSKFKSSLVRTIIHWSVDYIAAVFFMTLSTALLHKLPPNLAHRAALSALKYKLVPQFQVEHDCLRTKIFGLSFSNPLGLSAGFDKDAQAIGGILKLGFAFVEAGTVTPEPQPGNPRPNLFRLAEDKALINWLGIPSQGLEVFARRLESLPANMPGVVGANIGANTGSENIARDIAKCARRLAPLTQYLAVNVSCPNTPGLLDWQTPEGIRRILAGIREACANSSRMPAVLVKLSPDIGAEKLETILSVLTEAEVDGLILSNTTASRPTKLRSSWSHEIGGLSGPPLAGLSIKLLRLVRKMTNGSLPIISSGGIASVEEALARIRAGASLLQIYTSLVYQGPNLIRDMADGMARCLAANGLSSVSELVGRERT